MTSRSLAVNELADVAAVARLVRRDSTFGRFPGDVTSEAGVLIVNGRKITMTAEADPDALPWAAQNVDIVVEATGRFRTREAVAGHLRAGAARVLISVPGKDVDATIVMGVNDDTYDPETHRVISNASCTTNCVAPMVKVLHDAFGIEHGFMTTVHA